MLGEPTVGIGGDNKFYSQRDRLFFPFLPRGQGRTTELHATGYGTGNDFGRTVRRMVIDQNHFYGFGTIILPDNIMDDIRYASLFVPERDHQRNFFKRKLFNAE